MSSKRIVFLILLGAAAGWGPAGEKDPDAQRARMVRNQIKARGVRDEKVLEAMGRVPRHEFVPDSLQSQAYRDSPLPIGHGQTISQPYIVAAMTELLDLESDDSVLEVGTGSGYQAAILAAIVTKVYSVEIIAELSNSARQRLKKLGFTNVEVKHTDGYNGWLEHAPFDAIIVTAAASHIPPPLIEQLKPGAKMIIPVGPVFSVQYLMLVTKKLDGTVVKKKIMAVRFVPLTGEH